MTVRLSIYLETWACDLARRRLGRGAGLRVERGEGSYGQGLDERCLARDRPILLTREANQREIVAACCDRAARGGVRAGMTLAHARALLGRDPGPHVEGWDAASDARALEGLGRWMLRYVPVVGVDGADGLWLDATGCGRLHGSARGLAGRIVSALDQRGFGARIGMAPTWGGAWALARYGGRRIRGADTASLAQKLDPLPVAALRLDAGSAAALALLGVERIGQLRGLARGAVADRFEPGVLQRLDQALGAAIETVTALRAVDPVEGERVLDGPTTSPEGLRVLARELVEEIAGKLRARDRGCRVLEMTLERSDLEPLTLRVSSSRATRDGTHLWGLLAPGLERAQLGFGVEALRARAGQLSRVAHRQGMAWGIRAGRAGEDDGSAACAGRLVDTLKSRLGPGRVTALRVVESHVPERAECHEAVETVGAGKGLVGRVEADRPSRLFTPGLRAEPVVLAPDGPVALVRVFGGCGGGSVLHRVIGCIGPERIEGEWWRGGVGVGGVVGGAGGEIGAGIVGGIGVRDYFKVQTETGRWLWLCRSWRAERERWFVHGEWA